MDTNIQWFYLDDERPVPFGMDAILVPDYDSMMRTIRMCELYQIPYAIDFDYDLGDDYWNGGRIASYIVSQNYHMSAFRVHSANEEGADYIRRLLTEYGYYEEN